MPCGVSRIPSGDLLEPRDCSLSTLPLHSDCCCPVGKRDGRVEIEFAARCLRSPVGNGNGVRTDKRVASSSRVDDTYLLGRDGFVAFTVPMPLLRVIVHALLDESGAHRYEETRRASIREPRTSSPRVIITCLTPSCRKLLKTSSQRRLSHRESWRASDSFMIRWSIDSYICVAENGAAGAGFTIVSTCCRRAAQMLR